MKIRATALEGVFLLLLWSAAFWLWTLPFSNSPMPLGDVDASSHFGVGDYVSSHDRSILKIPYYLTFRYVGQNSAFPEYLWYPPQYWINTAIAQVIGGDRILPFFLFIAVFSSLIILTSYFLVRKLYGPWHAALASVLLVFSTRDIMVYLWGQWPQALSFALTPVVLYTIFRYQESYASDDPQEKKKRLLYAILLGVLLSAQFFFHPQGMIASIGASLIFLALLAVKHRRIPFSFRDVGITIALLATIAVAFAPFNVGEFLIEVNPLGTGEPGPAEKKPLELGKLFKWYQGIKNDPGLPDFYFTYNQSHGSLDGGLKSWWTLPFLLVGIIVLLLRRGISDLLMLSWFVSYYILTRLSVFGLPGRDMRMFGYEAHVFYPIIVIGVLVLASFAGQKWRLWAKIALAVSFIILAVSVNGVSAYSVFKGQQYSIGRINPFQYEAAEWLRANVPEDAHIYDIGTVGFQNYAAKIKWLNVLSQRHFIIDDSEKNLTTFVMVDYSDGMLLNNKEYVNGVRQLAAGFGNFTPLYSKNSIEVFALG